MKDATLAPVYAHLYPRLAETARSLGYALALHGTLGRDLDLIAAPWIENASEPAELVTAIANSCGGWAAEFANTGEGEPEQMPRLKPHGRLAWLIFMRGSSGYIDLSVMPLAPTKEETPDEQEGEAR